MLVLEERAVYCVCGEGWLHEAGLGPPPSTHSAGTICSPPQQLVLWASLAMDINQLFVGSRQRVHMHGDAATHLPHTLCPPSLPSRVQPAVVMKGSVADHEKRLRERAEVTGSLRKWANAVLSASEATKGLHGRSAAACRLGAPGGGEGG